MENKNKNIAPVIIGVIDPGMEPAHEIMRHLAQEHQIPLIVVRPDGGFQDLKDKEEQSTINYNMDAFLPEPFIIKALPPMDDYIIPRDKWGKILENKSKFHK